MRMNRGLWSAVVFVLVAGHVQAADEEVTMKGEVVEVSCYSKRGVEKGTGPAHVACAIECAKQGKVLGLLTYGDGLFKLIGEFAENNNAKLIPFIGKQVVVTGTLDRYTDYTVAVKPVKITVSK